MAQNSEQIEAKLCAYLEGELDEQGRAEIEKHLQSNPAHRKLLAEVAGTRGLVRALPRESAPPDLCETLQGQLERSVLLDDADEHADSGMRIGRWRPVLAMAAMVVLAVGLGLVIYFGLPSGSPPQHARSIATTLPADPGPQGGASSDRAAASSPAPDAVALRDGANDISTNKTDTDAGKTIGRARRGVAGGAADFAAAAPSDLAATNPTGVTAMAAAPTGTTQAGGSGGAAGASAHEPLAVLARRVPRLWSIEEQRALLDAWGHRPPGVPGDLANAALCFVVSTPEPAATRDEVTQELARLAIDWQSVAAPAPSLRQDASDPTPMPDRVASGPSPGGAVAMKQAKANKPAAAEERALAAPGGAAAGPTELSEATVAPSQPPAAPGAAGEAAVEVDGSTSDKVAALAPVAAADSPVRPSLIVARNVTRRQAESLRASLAGRADQQVAVWTAGADGLVALVNSETTPADADAAAVDDGNSAPRLAEVEPQSGSPAPAPNAAGGLSPAFRGGGQQGAGSAGRGSNSPGGFGRSAPSAGAPLPGVAGRSAPSDEANATEPAPASRDSRDSGGSQATDEARRDPAPAPPAAARGPARSEQTSGRSKDAETRAADSAVEELKDDAPASRPALGGQSSPAPAATPAEVPAAAEEDRVDLVILVKGPDAMATTVAQDALRGLSAAHAGRAAPAAPDGPIEKHEILTVTIGDADAANVRVGADGMIDLASAGRFAAEGMTCDALGTKIARTLARADAEPKVTVGRPGAAAPEATQPAEAGGAPLTSPQAPASAGDAPPGQPAAPADAGAIPSKE